MKSSSSADLNSFLIITCYTHIGKPFVSFLQPSALWVQNLKKNRPTSGEHPRGPNVWEYPPGFEANHPPPLDWIIPL